MQDTIRELVLVGVAQAALALSTAMVEAEGKGADFGLIDTQWINLTASLEACREAGIEIE